jgi:predicted MFS family arabinose efflux permease
MPAALAASASLGVALKTGGRPGLGDTRSDRFVQGQRQTMNHLQVLRPVLPILIGASLMLSLAMGIRQSLGIFLQPLTQGTGLSVSDFTLAIALQNVAWGVLQPFAGAWAVRLGFRPLMVGGAALYALGLVLLATAQGMGAVLLGGGLAIGASLAATGSAFALAVAARPVPAASRSMVLGFVSAAGSVGALIAAPIGQGLVMTLGWRAGLWGFVALALVMLPAAWIAGRVDALPPLKPTTADERSARQALVAALRNPVFVVMAIAYFVCGMQLVFLTTHLPSYLAICGMDPLLSAQALGMIGGFNVLGSLFFGWAGGRWNKLVLLGGIYVLRSLALLWYFTHLPTVGSTLVFAAIMGFLWMGVAPLVTGWLVDTFGLRWQAMLGGVAFVCHQLGSVVGAFGGGLVYDRLGSYNAAWQFGVTLGLVAGLVQIAIVWGRVPRPPAFSA